ncbi:MAG: hypothetical protein KAX49_14695 [Halanaerobiales bacterium]|nr:hypothetical protein [Halanaerobiales bacterium]
MRFKYNIFLVIISTLFLISLPCFGQDGFLTFTECTENGEQIPITFENSYYNMDINSYIDLQFNVETLKNDHGIISSNKSIELREKTSELTTFLAELNEHLETKKDYKTILKTISNYVEPIMENKKLKKVDLVKFLVHQINMIENEIAHESKLLIENSKMKLNIWCIHETKDNYPTRIYLKNYDDLKTGTYNSVDKVIYTFSDVEREHLTKNIQLYSELWKLIANIDAKKIYLEELFLDTKLHSFTTIHDKISIKDELFSELTEVVSIASLQPTIIDIPRTVRQKNDIYQLSIQLEYQGTLLKEENYYFKVQRYGQYNNFLGGLVFIKGKWTNSIQSVTSISWVLHNKPRPNNYNHNKLEKVLKLVNPGLGLNSVMIKGNNKIEYGIGVTITLFDDLVQFGYGYNLSNEGKGYFLLSTSLFELLF